MKIFILERCIVIKTFLTKERVREAGDFFEKWFWLVQKEQREFQYNLVLDILQEDNEKIIFCCFIFK